MIGERLKWNSGFKEKEFLRFQKIKRNSRRNERVKEKTKGESVVSSIGMWSLQKNGPHPKQRRSSFTLRVDIMFVCALKRIAGRGLLAYSEHIELMADTLRMI